MDNLEIRFKEYVSNLALLLSYGFSHGCSFDKIEKAVSLAVDSDLEFDQTRFVTLTPEENVSRCYETKDELIQETPNNLSFWTAELILRLAHSSKRSTAYLFVFLPLKQMSEMFPIYHEMDFSKSEDVFYQKQKKSTLLTLLLRQRKMSMKKLSNLTGISYPAVVKYCHAKELGSFSFANIMAISKVLEVNPEIFLEPRDSHKR